MILTLGEIKGTTNYIYDAIGQLTENVGESTKYFYNTEGLVTEVKKSNITVVKFYYDERGQRIRKEVFNTANGSLLGTYYYIRDVSGSISQTELPLYGIGRLGVYQKGSTPIEKYEITDHLGNVRVVIQRAQSIPVAYADYYPFGERLPSPRSSFSVGAYKYAYQGQEYDSETDMEAFQLRLWDGRIGRWLTTDPYGQYHSPYLGMGNDPVNGIDPDGGCFKEDGSDCNLNAEIGTTTIGASGYEWTMTKSGWARSDGFEVVLVAGQEYRNTSQFQSILLNLSYIGNKISDGVPQFGKAIVKTIENGENSINRFMKSDPTGLGKIDTSENSNVFAVVKGLNGLNPIVSIANGATVLTSNKDIYNQNTNTRTDKVLAVFAILAPFNPGANLTKMAMGKVHFYGEVFDGLNTTVQFMSDSGMLDEIKK